jgi:signal transduction histidine kinase
MWRELLNGPWPDQGNLPESVRRQAFEHIRRYWRGRIWLQIILGEAILWVAAEWQHVPHARAYLVPLILITLIYILGLFRPLATLWLVGMVVLFAIQGMLIRGLGAVTAVSYLLPYTFATMIYSGRRRVIIQAWCIIGFWFSLLYDLSPLGQQLEPPRYLMASYSILMAAATFQGLRFLNRLSIELNTRHVSQEVTEQVTLRSQQFLARVSHELRTPLNSVLGFAKMLRRSDLPTTQAGYLKQIIDEGEQLNHLISDLLDSAQLSAGKVTLSPGACDVNAICKTVSAEVQPILKPTVAFKMALSPDLPPIQADSLRLHQIVRNLVGNAAKYTAQGEITLATALHDQSITVAVSDTGPGIPADQQALVFVPFVKLDGRSAGVGLGLDIARQLARLHGGNIRLESVVGQGSTFTLELPVSQPPAG